MTLSCLSDVLYRSCDSFLLYFGQTCTLRMNNPACLSAPAYLCRTFHFSLPYFGKTCTLTMNDCLAFWPLFAKLVTPFFNTLARLAPYTENITNAVRRCPELVYHDELVHREVTPRSIMSSSMPATHWHILDCCCQQTQVSMTASNETPSSQYVLRRLRDSSCILLCDQ